MGQNVITIKIGNKSRDIKVPRSWDDLDDRTALLYYNTLFTGIGDERTHGVFTAVKLISLTQHILGFQTDMMARWEASFLKEDPVHGDLLFLEELKAVITATLTMVEDGQPKGLFEVVETESGTAYSVLYNRTRNPWPSLAHTSKTKKPKVTWLYAPADGLANITIYELAISFARYEAYVETRDEKFANELIGIIYRRSRTITKKEKENGWRGGDRREYFRDYEEAIARRAKLASTLPTLTRRFIVFWFAGCREAIAQRYSRVFKKGGAVKAKGNEWGRLLLTLAETGAFGDLGLTSDQHYSNALEFMSMKDEQREEREREAEAEAAKRRRK